jgi:hypothetical protein
MASSKDVKHKYQQSLHLAQTISVLGGNVHLQRNRVFDGTTKGIRIDSHEEQPPVVVMKEKEEASDLAVAMHEGRTKFAWIPHYARLKFVICIAIAGNLVQFFTFSRQGMLTSSQQFNLDFMLHRARYDQG